MRATTPSELEKLRRTDTKWERHELLGSGGMADTYLGVRRRGAAVQRVCLKEVHARLWFNSEFREAFLKEAAIVASLRYSNIVGVIEIDDELGRLVLELVEGVDLLTLVNSLPGRRLPPDLVVLIATELCKAFECAHSRTHKGERLGVVHRDLSAANVMISRRGEVKLTDFGLATTIAREGEPHSTTVRGKYPYFSPEQSRGESLDGRSDLFALGVLCYQLIAGRRPFDAGEEEATVRAICAGRHTSLSVLAPDASAELVGFVERLLSTSRDDRYPDAAACLDVLEHIPTRLRCRDLGQLVQAIHRKKTLDVDVLALRERNEGAVEHDSLSASETTLLARPMLGRGGRRWLFPGALVAVVAVTLALFWVGAEHMRPASGMRDAGYFAASHSPPREVEVDTRQATPLQQRAAQAVISGEGGAPSTPTRVAGDSPDVTERAQSPNAPAPALPADSRVAPRREPEPSATAVKREDEAPATLRIGTLPFAQVWVDDQPRGWAPVTVSLPPGRHTVAAGKNAPEVTRTVRLRAAQSSRLLLELPGQLLGQLPPPGQTH